MLEWPDGTIWVGDFRLDEVHEVSADGTQSRRVIRSGEGPGEMPSGTQGIHSLPGGGVVVRTTRTMEYFRGNKRFDRRQNMRHSIWGSGFAVAPDGGFIDSAGYGIDEGHDLARYAVHRFNRRARHVTSWHPTADHDDWEVVRSVSGGPVALTRDGGLLVSDAAPFRITRYSDLEGNGARVIIENDEVLSSAELDRAVTRGPNNSISYTNAWSRSSYVEERADGTILNVILVFPESSEEETSSRWILGSPDGQILADTRVADGYNVWNRTADGHYLAAYWDGETLQWAAAKVEVTITPK